MKHSKMLFVDEETTVPLQFVIRPSAEKVKIRPLIEHGGGIMVTKCSTETIRLVEPGAKVLTSDHNTLSTKYIYDCVSKNILLDKKPYQYKIRSSNVSDISINDEDIFKIRTSERNLKTCRPYAGFEDEKILNFIVKTKRYSEVKGNNIWKAMANSGKIDGRSWQSLRERFLKQIAPNLKRFNLTESQMSYFQLTIGPQHKTKRKKTDTYDKYFTQREDWAIFRFIFNHSVHEDIKGDELWIRMEKRGITTHTWKSMKNHFFKEVIPKISTYNLPKVEIDRLAAVIDLPINDVDEVGEGSSSQNDDYRIEDSDVSLTDDDDTVTLSSRGKSNDDSYTEAEVAAILKFISKRFVYEDITDDRIWKKMEVGKVTSRSSKSMKNTFFSQIIPNIYRYNVPKSLLAKLAGVVSIPDPPSSVSSSSSSSEKTKSPMKKTVPKSPLKEQQAKNKEDLYSDKESLLILKSIFKWIDGADNRIVTDFMWKKLESMGQIKYTWQSMKYHFENHIVPNIRQYNLSKEEMKRLSNLVNLNKSANSSTSKDVGVQCLSSSQNSSVEHSLASQGDSPPLQLKSLQISLGAKLGSSPQKATTLDDSVDCLDRELLKNANSPVLRNMQLRMKRVLQPQEIEETAVAATPSPKKNSQPVTPSKSNNSDDSSPIGTSRRTVRPRRIITSSGEVSSGQTTPDESRKVTPSKNRSSGDSGQETQTTDGSLKSKRIFDSPKKFTPQNESLPVTPAKSSSSEGKQTSPGISLCTRSHAAQKDESPTKSTRTSPRSSMCKRVIAFPDFGNFINESDTENRSQMLTPPKRTLKTESASPLRTSKRQRISASPGGSIQEPSPSKTPEEICLEPIVRALRNKIVTIESASSKSPSRRNVSKENGLESLMPQNGVDEGAAGTSRRSPRIANQGNHVSPSSSFLNQSTAENSTLEDELKKSNCISTNSIVLMETAKEGVSELLEDVTEWLDESTSTKDGTIKKEVLAECREKLEHLNEVVQRALLAARVERIMEKSPNYITNDDQLALYKELRN